MLSAISPNFFVHMENYSIGEMALHLLHATGTFDNFFVHLGLANHSVGEMALYCLHATSTFDNFFVHSWIVPFRERAEAAN